METLKIIGKAILVSYIWYIIFAFIGWDINIQNWSNWTRFWYLLLTLLSIGKSIE